MAAADHLSGQQFNEQTAQIAAKSDYSNWISPSSSLHGKIGWVPTSTVASMREYHPHELRDPANVPHLAEDISEHGFKSPLIMEYGQNERTAYLGEGNHRLAAAERLGLSHVPVHVMRSMRTGSPRARRVPGAAEDVTGYVPGNMHPSEIGLPTHGH